MVQKLDWKLTQSLIEKPVPLRVGSFRRFGYNIGRTVTVTGLMEATTQAVIFTFMELLRRLVGSVDVFDPGDGSQPFNALISDPAFDVVAGDWFSGVCRITYAISFTEMALTVSALSAVTKLLLHMQTDFSDSSAYGRVPTLVNTPTIDLGFNPFGTSGRGVFNLVSSPGSRNYVTFPASPDFLLNGDFTLEMALAFSGSSPGAEAAFLAQFDPSYANQMVFGSISVGSGQNQLVFDVQGNSTQIISLNSSANFSVTPGVWTWFSLSRQGSNFRFFVNGNQLGSTLTSSAYPPAAINGPLLVLVPMVTPGTAGTVYASELRFTNGLARYLGNYTPSTALFPANN